MTKTTRGAIVLGVMLIGKLAFGETVYFAEKPANEIKVVEARKLGKTKTVFQCKRVKGYSQGTGKPKSVSNTQSWHSAIGTGIDDVDSILEAGKSAFECTEKETNEGKSGFHTVRN